MFPGKDYRGAVSDPTKNLLNVMRSNSFTRIKSALAVPGIHYGSRDSGNEFQTLLMRACNLDMAPRNRRDMARILMEKRDLDVNATDADGRTALAHACIMGDTTMVKLLVDYPDVDPNIPDREGDTPLMHACRGGQIQVVTTILTTFKRLGLQVDDVNNQGMTPLIEAARGGHAGICRRLVTVGNADVNARDGNSFNTAQDYAIASRRLSTPDILLLSPIAQRKLQARKKREAMGRSSMSELMKRDWFYPTSGWQHEESGSGNTFVIEDIDGEGKKQQKIGQATLQQEHLQQLNSAVFQVAKYGLSRVAEQRQEEDKHSVCTEKPRQGKISTSLPDLREEDLFSKSSSSRSSSPSKNSTNPDNHLHATHRPSPSTSLTPSRKSYPNPSSIHRHQPKSASPRKQPLAQHPRARLRLPSVDSPNHSSAPTTRRRKGSLPNKMFTGPQPVVSESSTASQLSLGLSKSPPNCWAPSTNNHNHSPSPVVAANKNVKPKRRLSWEGKPSSSVPSYLFR